MGASDDWSWVRDDEKPARLVTVAPFYLSAIDVTVAQFRHFIEETGYEPSKKTKIYADGGSAYVFPDSAWYKPYLHQTEDDPVVCVSWYDAVAYCNWASQRDGLKPVYTITNKAKDMPMVGMMRWTETIVDASANGYRLPGEAEWEFACRAGSTSMFPQGKTINTSNANFNGLRPLIDGDHDKHGWFLGQTTPVASYPPNVYGIYDLQGNVSQWCGDTVNLKYPLTGDRIKKGGDWWSGISRQRPSARDHGLTADNRTGFRLARNAD